MTYLLISKKIGQYKKHFTTGEETALHSFQKTNSTDGILGSSDANVEFLFLFIGKQFLAPAFFGKAAKAHIVHLKYDGIGGQPARQGTGRQPFSNLQAVALALSNWPWHLSDEKQMHPTCRPLGKPWSFFRPARYGDRLRKILQNKVVK